MSYGADIVDAYYTAINKDKECRNIKTAQRQAYQRTTGYDNEDERNDYKKLSLTTVPTSTAFSLYLEKTLDMTYDEFEKLLKLEVKLNKFVLKHEYLNNKIDIIKKCLFNRKYKLIMEFKELIPSNFVTKWIYWNKCKIISYSLDSILLMLYDTFIVIYDLYTLRRCIYRTNINSEADPKLLAGSKLEPVFAYAESGIHYPKIFVVGYHQLVTISKLDDHVKGQYIGLEFSLRKVIISIKAGYERKGLRMVIWNWSKGEKTVIYEQDPSSNILSDCALFKWQESIGIGIILRSNTEYNQQCQLVNVINATIFKQKLFQNTMIFYKFDEKYYQSFVPKDICIFTEESIYILDERGDLYVLEGVVSIRLFLKKKWQLLHKRPKCQVRLVSYRNGFLIYGPEGVLRRYYQDKYKEWHCSWWMDLYDAKIKNIIVFGKPENLYVLCPFKGILRLKDDNSNNNSFEITFKFEKDKINDIIIVQPACEYVLAVFDRRNIHVLNIANCSKIATMSFPEKFDKFPYLSNPCYPYIIFISDRVGIFYIYDIENYEAPFIAAKIFIGPHRITNASFSYSGTLLYLWIGGINQKLIYWAVRTNKSYNDFKIILNVPSSDNSVQLSPYVTSAGEFYVLVMEKKKTNLNGNRVTIYKFPEKRLIGICILDNYYKNLYFTMQSVNYVFAPLESNPNKLVKFSFTFKQRGEFVSIEQSKENITFSVPHKGEFDLLFTFQYTFIYGLEDGLLVVLDMHEEKIKEIFCGYFHRGAINNYESNNFVGGGIKRCLGSQCGNFIVILAKNGILTGHKFRKSRAEDSGYETSNRFDVIKQMEVVSAESCISVSVATMKFPTNIALLETKNIRNPKDKEQPIKKSSKWAHCYATQFALTLVPKTLSSSSSNSTDGVANQKSVMDIELINITKTNLQKEFETIYCKLLKLLRDFYHRGRMTLPFPLFIINRDDLKEFFRRMNDIEVHTEANIKRRMIRLMQETITLVKEFREPFNNAQLIRGILNPEIKAWSIGTKFLPQKNNWKRICEEQWIMREVLNCGYGSVNTFPINPKMQKKIKMKKETFPDISCLNTPEVLYVSRKTVKGFKESDLRTINKTIQEASLLKTLRTALEFYSRGSNIEGICNSYQSPIDYKSLLEKLCKKKSYSGVNHLNKAITEIMNQNKIRLGSHYNKNLLTNVLPLNQARFYEIKDNHICRKCKNVPIYDNCTHKPKCYPCFHGIKCTLSKYIFPESIRVIRAPDVSPNIFCKPMRYINYYRFVLHPHIKCCSLDLEKGFEVLRTRTDEGKDKQLQILQTEKPDIIEDALTIINKRREFPTKNVKLFSKNTEHIQGDVIWDESLMELIRICSVSSDCELLLRKLFFKCSQRLFCKDQREYLLLKSLKHLMKYTSFFPLHTYLALPWLRDLVKEVTDLEHVQTEDYKEILKLYPDILTYKKTEFHDPFKIPKWWYKFLEIIAEARKSLNHKLANVYVMISYEDLFPKEDSSDVSSDDSIDSEIAKSPADVICGYKKVPCHQVTDVGRNEEIHRYGGIKVRKVYPASERLLIRTYNNKFKKDLQGSLEKYFLSKRRNVNQLKNNPRLTMALTRYDSSKYTDPVKDEISICTELDKFPECVTKRLQVDLPRFYLNKANLLHGPNSIYKAENSLDNTETILEPQENVYQAVPVTNISDPFVPVQPHHPNTKYWRPFTLKWLLSMKKPLSPRLLSIVSRLMYQEIPSDIYDWFKTFVGLIYKIQRVIKNRLLNYDLKKINKLQYHEYTKIQKLIYPIKLIETAQWLALIIHTLSVINQDIIDSTKKIMDHYCGDNIYKKHPLHIPENRYPIKGKPFDPRDAFKLVVGARFPNSDKNTLLEELKKTNQLGFQSKMYEPQKDLRRFLDGPVHNAEYVLKLLINRQLLQIRASKSALQKAPKDWFKWRPLQQGAPNWVLMIIVTFASKIFCCTLNNITRRLYKILRDSRKYICRKATEQSFKKRTNVEDIIEKYYEKRQETTINEEVEKIIWEQPKVTVNYNLPDNTLTRYSDTTSRNERNLAAWRKHEKEFLGRIKRKRLTEKERMEAEIEDMLKADEKGWEMYLEHKRYWEKGFRADPLHVGFPPVFDKKNREIIDFGDNFRGCSGENNQFPEGALPDLPSKSRYKKVKDDKKIEKEKHRRLKRKKERLFMKKLIIDGPSARYTAINTYYSNRFDYFSTLNAKYFYNVLMLTVEKLSTERNRILGDLRTVKHHIINFMFLMHIKREHIKKKLVYFCECDDYYMMHYKRQMKLIPDEKLNYLYEVDDEDNMFYRNGNRKEQTDSSCDGIVDTKYKDDEPYIDKVLTSIMGGTMEQNYLTTLKAPYLKPLCFHNEGELNEKQRLKIERDLKKGIILKKERDLTIMEFKREMGWFSVYKEWFKWSFDYILAYNGAFQMLGIENAIKAEETKFNSIQKVKWEIRKLIGAIEKIRRCYLINITEYLYVRSTILSDIEYFRDLQSRMAVVYEEIEKINAAKEDLKERILRENPYLKESTLDRLLTATVSLELLKNVSSQDLKIGYKFYFLRKKPVYHFYQLNTQIGKYYHKVKSLNDVRLYPIMSAQLRREMIDLRIKKQILQYKVYTGQRKNEEFYKSISRSYKYIITLLEDVKRLHQTCFRKLNLLKKVLIKKVIPVTATRKQLDQPLWKLVKPYTENKDVRFVAFFFHKTDTKSEDIKELHRFREGLFNDRLLELYAIRKTLAAELELKKLYIKLLKMPAARYLDGVNEDMIEHYRQYIKKNGDVGIPTNIKAYDKVMPKLHLQTMMSNYIRFITHKKCLEFEREKRKRNVPYSRLEQETPPACDTRKISKANSSKKSYYNVHYGILAWFVKGLWESTDFKKFYKPDTHVDGNISTVAMKTHDNCSLLEHSNKVYDFLRAFIIPKVPPPSPASSHEVAPIVKMLSGAQGEEDYMAYQQDEIIFNYLCKQIQKLTEKLDETGKTFKDIPPKELEIIFQKWLNKLFSNWHVRVPQNLESIGDEQQACSILQSDYDEIKRNSIYGYLISLINRHSSKLENRNIDRAKSDIAFTEHEVMLRKCIEHMSTLYPPENVNEIIDECSGTERKCSISVYAKFENNLDYTLSEEQYLLILNLINEHIKKYNKDRPVPDDNCSHVNIIREDLFKDWISFAFEKIFLNPAQYIFIKSGERLIKMYDNMDERVRIKYKQSKLIKPKEMIISFLQEYRDLERNYPNIHIAEKLAEQERIKKREPLLFKWTSLKKQLDKLRKQNKQLEIILSKEMKRTYPVFGEEIVPINEKLGKLLLDICS